MARLAAAATAAALARCIGRRRSGRRSPPSALVFNVYGLRQDPNSAYAAVIARFRSRIAADLPVTIYGDGLQTRDFIHVSDTARAIACALRATTLLAGTAVNIGTGSATSVLALASLIARVLGKSPSVTHAAPRAGEVRESVAVTERAAALIGFRATMRIEDGLASMCR